MFKTEITVYQNGPEWIEAEILLETPFPPFKGLGIELCGGIFITVGSICWDHTKNVFWASAKLTYAKTESAEKMSAAGFKIITVPTDAESPSVPTA